MKSRHSARQTFHSLHKQPNGCILRTFRCPKAIVTYIKPIVLSAATACSAHPTSLRAPPVAIGVNIVNPLIPSLEDVALVQQSRMSGIISADNRLVVISTTSGEEVWWKNDVSSFSGYIPYSVRDGTVLKSPKQLSLFLLNGGSSTFPITDSYFTHRGTNDTQFLVTYENRTEVINLVEAKKTDLPRDSRLGTIAPSENQPAVKSSVFTFFNSATNDQVISLDVLSLKFIRYNAIGVSAAGTSQFSADASVYCEASDLAKVSSQLFLTDQSNNSQSTINPSRLPVALAFDASYSGALIKTQDGGLIHLNFNRACAGESAITLLPSDQQQESSNKHQLFALGDSNYAMLSEDKNLKLVGIENEILTVGAEIDNACSNDVVTYRKYGDDVLFVCGRISKDGLKIESVDSLQLVSLTTNQVLLETTTIDNSSVAGLAFDNNSPALYQLSDRSKGKLTKYDLSSGTPQRETRDNIILKGILNKL